MKPLNLLLLDCSPRRDYSTSRHLTEQLLPALSAHFGREIHVMRRNLGTEPLPAITAEYAESLLLAIAAQRRAVVTQASWQAFPRSHIPASTSSTAPRPDGCQTGNAVRSEPIWRGDAAFPNMESFHLPQHGEAS